MGIPPNALGGCYYYICGKRSPCSRGSTSQWIGNVPDHIYDKTFPTAGNSGHTHFKLVLLRSLIECCCSANLNPAHSTTHASGPIAFSHAPCLNTLHPCLGISKSAVHYLKQIFVRPVPVLLFQLRHWNEDLWLPSNDLHHRGCHGDLGSSSWAIRIRDISYYN